MNEVPSQWGVERVCSWLEQNGQGHLCGVFRQNKIDGSNLLQLTKADLKDELEIQALGDRKAILEGIDRLRANRASPFPVPPSISPSISPSSRTSVSPSGLGTDCCEHCYKPFLLNEKPILLTLPGATRAATLHLRCKENWAWGHAKHCKQCLKPMTQHITTVSGVGFKAELHPECVSTYERSRGVTRSSSPPPPRTASPVVDNCAQCLTRFTSFDAPILYSLPGETRTVELHPHCKDNWATSNARKCDQCFIPMTKEVITLSSDGRTAMVHPECKDRYNFDRERKSPMRSPRSVPVTVPSVDHCAHCLMRFSNYDSPILFTLPGEASAVELHPHCKSGWAERHARRCDECHSPLTHESITLTGSFGTAVVHPECRELYSLRKSASPSPPPVRSASPISDHCAHCSARFTSFDSPIIFTLPGETKSVELHPRCRDSWANRHAKRCDECGAPIPKEVISLKGSWGTAHVHPECQDRFTQKKGATVSPRLSPRSGSPVPMRSSPTLSAHCAQCLKSFTSYDSPIIYSLPGEVNSVDLHPFCKDGWVNIHAKRCDECSNPLSKEIITLKGGWGTASVHPECKERYQLRKSVPVSPRSTGGSPVGGSCEHCFKGFTSYDAPVLLTLPGASRAAEVHEQCKMLWARRHSKLCDHCREPMIDSITSLSGTFGTAELHKSCVAPFELSRNIKSNTASSPTPVVTDRCSYCHFLFKDGELTSVVSLPGSTAAGKLHPNCVDSWSKLHAKLCDHCSKPMPVDVTTLSGVWGTAEVHPECVNLFKDNVHRRGYSSSAGTSPIKTRSSHICAQCNNSISSSEIASIISFPELSNVDTHLHDRCIDSFRRRIGRVCTWCDGTISGQLTEIKGDFGAATVCVLTFECNLLDFFFKIKTNEKKQLHPSCLLPFKKAKGIF